MHRVVTVLGLLAGCGGGELDVSPSSLDFGEVDFQQEKPPTGYEPMTVLIENVGAGTLDVQVLDFDTTHLMLGAQLASDDPPTLMALEPEESAAVTVGVWDYLTDGGTSERDTLVTGTFRLSADGLKDPVDVPWSFTPVRDIDGDTDPP